MSTEVDPQVGEVNVRIDTDAGFVEVHGPGIPTAQLRCRDGGMLDRYSRIGSRDRKHLQLRLGGAEARITPAPGGITRRSYRVDGQVDGVRYRLVPDGPGTSALRRDGAPIGTMRADDSGGVRAEWVARRRVEPRDAALGYLLAAAYGTGAPPAWEVLLQGLFALGSGAGG